MSTIGQRSRDALNTLLDRVRVNCGPLGKQQSCDGQLIESAMEPADIEIGLSEARQAIRPRADTGDRLSGAQLRPRGKRRLSGKHPGCPARWNSTRTTRDSLMALAKAQVRFGDYPDAVANAERARRLHPLAPEYYTYVHGQALYAAGRADEADSVLGECLLRAPQEANCLLIRRRSSRAGRFGSGAGDHGPAAPGRSAVLAGGRTGVPAVRQLAADGPLPCRPGAGASPRDGPHAGRSDRSRRIEHDREAAASLEAAASRPAPFTGCRFAAFPGYLPGFLEPHRSCRRHRRRRARPWPSP